MTTPIHPKLAEITERIIERSRPTRKKYLAKIRNAKQMGRLERNQLGCSNLAHGYASMPQSIKIEMLQETVPNLGIITAYNDMVSAHQPFKDFPDLSKTKHRKTMRPHKSPAVRPPCATASRKATPVWNCRCFPVM